ncbi:MAG: hypothetical protein WCO44_00760 [Bacteroidota bacterium]
MNRNKTLGLSLVAIALFLMTACAVVPHPNEKIIVGLWKPVKVERVIDSSALLAAHPHAGDTTAKAAVPGKPGAPGKAGEAGAAARRGANLEHLQQIEMRATLEIFANKTAIKHYPGKPLNATWKMKGKGTRIVAKNLATKSKFVIDIEDISQDRLVIMEHAQSVDVRVTYERQK